MPSAELEGGDVGDEDALAVVRELEGFAHGGVVKGELGYAEFRVVVVGAVLDVLQEAFHDGSGNDVAGVVRLAEALEGDADGLAVLEDGAAGIAGIDRGVDLDDEV